MIIATMAQPLEAVDLILSDEMLDRLLRLMNRTGVAFDQLVESAALRLLRERDAPVPGASFLD